MTYTAEQLRAKARNLRELGRQLAADDCEAHAAALEEHARLKAERDTSVAVTERIKVALRIRGTGSYVEWAEHCRDALDKLECELTAERERADRSKAEGIKEGMRRAAEIAEEHASVEGIAQRIRAAILKEAGE